MNGNGRHFKMKSMKTYTIVVLLMISKILFAQEQVEKITKEFTFQTKSTDNILIVDNLNGHVKVEGYSGDKILVEATKRIRAKSKEDLDKGIREINLGSMNLSDTVILFAENPCHAFGKKKEKYNKNDYWAGSEWHYQWNNCQDKCEEGFDWTLDFVIKIPASVNLMVSTINQGDISVAQVNGRVVANNINGAIRLDGLSREAIASTINGNVDIEYVKNPQKNCRFYTLNGDINALFQPGLAANVSFESFNGDLYTNIDKLESLPVSVDKEKTKDGTKYKVNTNRYKIGQGGAVLDF